MITTFNFPGPIPKEVLEFFRRKRLQPAFSYQDVWRDEHDFAFTIAKLLETDLLGDMQASIAKAIEEGWSYDQWAKDAEQQLQDAGWWGRKEVIDPKTGEVVKAQLGSPSRLATIFRTNFRTAHAAGQWDRIQETKDSHPYLLYTLGPSKEHRVDHVAWHGTLLPVDDPWWRTHYPPNGWGCKCRVRQVSPREYARLREQGTGAPPGQKGRVPVQTDAPPTQYVEWERRDGVKLWIPQGIDPGWDYPPGKAARKARLNALLSEQSLLSPTQLEETAIPTTESVVRDWREAVDNDPEIRGYLEGMENEAGWAERGGQLLRNEKGEAVGRTGWVPRAQWWGDYKAQWKPGLRANQATEAIKKALAGEKLKKSEEKFISWVVEYIDEQKALNTDVNNEMAQLLVKEKALIASLMEELKKNLNQDIIDSIYQDVVDRMPNASQSDLNIALIHELRTVMEEL